MDCFKQTCAYQQSSTLELHDNEEGFLVFLGLWPWPYFPWAPNNLEQLCLPILAYTFFGPNPHDWLLLSESHTLS